MKSRRNFIKIVGTTAAAVSLESLIFPQRGYANILGANDRIHIAVIGVRSRAKALTRAIAKYPNAKIIYTCDVDDGIIEKNNVFCQETLGYVPKVTSSALPELLSWRLKKLKKELLEKFIKGKPIIPITEKVLVLEKKYPFQKD